MQNFLIFKDRLITPTTSIRLAVPALLHVSPRIRQRLAHVSQLRLDPHAVPQRLQHDAVSLAQTDQLVHLPLVFVLDLQPHPQRDLLEPDADVGAVVGLDAQRPAEVERALGRDAAAGDGDAHARADGADRDAEARDERLEQHVARAQLRRHVGRPGPAAGRGVHAGNALRGGGRGGGERAGQGRGVEGPGRGEGDERRGRVGAVAVFEGLLFRAQGGGRVLGRGGGGGGHFGWWVSGCRRWWWWAFRGDGMGIGLVGTGQRWDGR